MSGPKSDALAGLPLLADHLAHALELIRHALVGRDDVVEGGRDAPRKTIEVARHARREIAFPDRLERAKQADELASSKLVDGKGALAYRIIADGHMAFEVFHLRTLGLFTHMRCSLDIDREDADFPHRTPAGRGLAAAREPRSPRSGHKTGEDRS